MSDKATEVKFKIILLCVCLGSEASIVVAVKQLERYPVDLYYLVDVSASMQENLDHVGVHTLSCLCSSQQFSVEAFHLFVWRKQCISNV